MSVSLFYPRRFGLHRHRIFPACAACPAAVHFSVTPGAAPIRPHPAPVNGRGAFAPPRTGYSLQPVAVSRRACRRALSVIPEAAPIRPRPAPVNGRGAFASPRTGYSLQPVAVSRRACQRALSVSPCTGRADIGLSIPPATLRPGTQPSAAAAAVSARNGRTLRGARSFGPGARR